MRPDVVKVDQVNPVAFAVLRHFKQVNQAQEARFARQLWSDIRETDRRNGIDLYFAFLHGIAGAHCDMRACPYTDAASDFSAANAFAEALGEHHQTSICQPSYGSAKSE